MMTKSEKKELNGIIHEILLRRDKKCLRCTKPDFQASHIFPKGTYRRMEFEPDNIIALCYACHIHWWHKNPFEAKDWLEFAIDPERLKKLNLMRQTGAGTTDYKLLKIALNLELQNYE